jgi:hypothetical protein
MKIWAFKPSTNINISTQCFGSKKKKFAKLLGEFQKIFVGPYKDLSGFNPVSLQNVISIKECMKPILQEQRSINSSLNTTFQRELENFLGVGIIFSVHLEWVSNWEPTSRTTKNIRTYINLRTFRQAIMRNPFPSLNMKTVL